MHHLMAGYASVGHSFGEAGLGELLVESDVYIVGRVQQNLSEKEFDKVLREFQLVDEAF